MTAQACHPPAPGIISEFIQKQKDLKGRLVVRKFKRLLKSIVGDETKYCIAFDSQNGPIGFGKHTGNMHAVIKSVNDRIHTERHVSLYYIAKTRQLEVVYYKGYPIRSDGDDTIVKKQFFKFKGIPHMRMRKKVDEWFTKQVYTNYLVEISFTTEFPLFNYRNKFYVDSLTNIATDKMIDHILTHTINPAINAHPKEVKRFYNAYTSAQNMKENVMTCNIRSLETEMYIARVGDKVGLEIAEHIYAKLKPIKSADEIKNERMKYYFDYTYWLISRLWNSPTPKPRELSF